MNQVYGRRSQSQNKKDPSFVENGKTAEEKENTRRKKRAKEK
jgi:hypothetical protein